MEGRSRVIRQIRINSSGNMKNNSHKSSCTAPVVDQHRESRQDLLDGLHGRRRVLVPAQVHHHPGNIPKEADRDLRVDEGQEGLDDPQLDDVVPKVRAVSYDVPQGPHSLRKYFLRL